MAVNWDDFRFLLALRTAGSLGAAARRLQVDASTVSRRLASLEAALGTQLAQRTPDGLTLTEAGERASELAMRLDADIDALARTIGGDDQKPEGLVRIAATESMATFLMQGLMGMREAYPRIVVHLVVSSAALDLLRREADLAVRLFRDPSPTLITRKVGELGWSLYAGEDYVARRKPALPASPCLADMAGHDVVSYRGPASRSPGGAWLAANSRPEDVVCSGDGVLAVANAVREGMGLSALPCFVTRAHPSLVRLTPRVVATSEAFVALAPDLQKTARVRIVVDALVDLFARERGFLQGHAPP